MSSIFAVLNKGRKVPLFHVIRGPPYFGLATCSDGKVGSIGREFNVLDLGLEVEVVKDSSADKVCQNCAAIFIDSEEKGSLWREGYPGDILAVLESEGERLIAESYSISVVLMSQKCVRYWPYLTRSKHVTLLPTGESRELPSGVKTRFPRQ